MFRCTSIVTFAILTICAAASADTVCTRDGRTIHGKVTSADRAPTVVVETPAGRLQLRRSMVASIEKNDLGLPGQAPTESPAGGKVTQEQRDEFIGLSRLENECQAGPEGVRLWQGFIEKHPECGLTSIARKKLAEWQDRTEKDLVRFGANWLPSKDVSERREKAQSLFRKANGIGDMISADSVYQEAIDANPYMPEIHLRRAERWYKEGDRRKYGQALGGMVQFNDCHTVARNNLGVLAAENKQWDQAVRNFCKAAMGSQGDPTVMANLNQALFMQIYATFNIAPIVQEGYAPIHVTNHPYCRHSVTSNYYYLYNNPYADKGDWQRYVTIAIASTRVATNSQLDHVVRQLNAAGHYKGQHPWGKQWVSEAEFKKKVSANNELVRQIGLLETKIRGIESRRSYAGDPTRELRAKLYPLVWKLDVPWRTGNYVMISHSGVGTLETVEAESSSHEYVGDRPASTNRFNNR